MCYSKVLRAETLPWEKTFEQAILAQAISLQTELLTFFVVVYLSATMAMVGQLKRRTTLSCCALVFMQGRQHTAIACLCP